MARIKVNSRGGLETSFALWAASIFSIALVCFNRASAQEKPSAQAKPAEIAPVVLPVPQLVDITASTRIHFEHLSSPEQKFIVESMSGGVALIDYDGDGWLDIYFTGAPNVAMQLEGKKARGALYHNNHDGTFTDVTDKAGVATPCWAMGVAVGDYNNDGRPDLYGELLWRSRSCIATMEMAHLLMSPRQPVSTKM